MSGRDVFIDVRMRVAPEQAIELMLHHLGLAAAYFEATPDDQNALAILEAKRVLGEDIEFRAAYAWLNFMLFEYEKLKSEYGDGSGEDAGA